MKQYDDVDDDDGDEEDDDNNNEDDDDVCSCHLFCPATSWLTSDGYPISWSVWVSLSSPYHLPDEKKTNKYVKIRDYIIHLFFMTSFKINAH